MLLLIVSCILAVFTGWVMWTRQQHQTLCKDNTLAGEEYTV